MTATAPVRAARNLSQAELLASAEKRLSDLVARHGAASPQVAAAFARWEAMVSTRTRDDDDLTALLTSLGSTR